MKRSFSIASLAAMLIGLPVVVRADASRFTVYFLAVGSGDYARPKAPLKGFGDIDGAAKSAERVAALLARNGARYGILLASQPDRYITRADVLDALRVLVGRVRKDHPTHPEIVFYFVGHGVSEGIGWNHFSVPGTFVYRGSADLTVASLSEHAIYDGDVTDVLDKSGAHYFVLLDNCSEGNAATFASAVLTQEATRNMTDTAAAVQALNEFRQPDPVLFSTSPGTQVQPAPDPRAPNDLIGPLSRRLTLLVAQASSVLSLRRIVTELTDAALDPETKPAVTHAELIRPRTRSS
jgi:hypothetical protein